MCCVVDFMRSKLCSLIKICGRLASVATSWNAVKSNTFDNKWCDKLFSTATCAGRNASSSIVTSF